MWTSYHPEPEISGKQVNNLGTTNRNRHEKLLEKLSSKTLRRSRWLICFDRSRPGRQQNWRTCDIPYLACRETGKRRAVNFELLDIKI